MKKRKERIDRGIKVRSTDIFALSSWREMLYLAVPRLLPVVACLVLPLVLGVYWQKVLLSVAVFALLAISWDILAQTGMVSLGQALFFGVGCLLCRCVESLLGIVAVYHHARCSDCGRADLHPFPASGTAAAGHLFFHGYPDYPADAGKDHRSYQDFRRHRRA